MFAMFSLLFSSLNFLSTLCCMHPPLFFKSHPLSSLISVCRTSVGYHIYHSTSALWQICQRNMISFSCGDKRWLELWYFQPPCFDRACVVSWFLPYLYSRAVSEAPEVVTDATCGWNFRVNIPHSLWEPRDGMRAREMDRVEYSPAATKDVVVSFKWFGIHFALMTLLAGFINAKCNRLTFSFRSRVVSYFLWLCCFSGFLELSSSVEDKPTVNHRALIQSVWLQCFLSHTSVNR